MYLAIVCVSMVADAACRGEKGTEEPSSVYSVVLTVDFRQQNYTNGNKGHTVRHSRNFQQTPKFQGKVHSDQKIRIKRGNGRELTLASLLMNR